MFKKAINYGVTITFSDSNEDLFRETLIVSDKDAAEQLKKVFEEPGIARLVCMVGGLPDEYADEIKCEVKITPFKEKLIDVTKLAFDNL